MNDWTGAESKRWIYTLIYNFESRINNSLMLARRDPKPNQSLRTIDATGSWAAYIGRCPSTESAAGTWNVCRVAIEKAGSPEHVDMMSAGWLPSKKVAEFWLQTALQKAP